MVAKVISGKDIRGVLNYNEQKVQSGSAQCIQANGFLKQVESLNFHEKLARFTRLHERNTRTKTNTLHVSLNFDAAEKLNTDKLNAIATTYMNKIGFGDQPYLVYQHHDAAHPHIHIVSSLIQTDGKRIPIHNLGKNQSEVARKEIEKQFQLVQAGAVRKPIADRVKPIDVQRVQYGKAETHRSIANIVRTVTRAYRYTSLPELNAVLRHYNVMAERGSEHSQMFQKRGLLYSLIDVTGKRIGVPVKASAIHGKPTLAFLEKQFTLNEVLRQPHREPLKHMIDEVLRTAGAREAFAEMLAAKGIQVLFRTNAEGRTYGVTFIDHKRHIVFNGSALGKAYSAAALFARMGTAVNDVKQSIKTKHMSTSRDDWSTSKTGDTQPASPETFLEKLVMADGFDPLNPESTLKLRRRKKRKRSR